jgi:hypothetical protein
MLHQKETDRIRAYPTHQAVQTTGSTAPLGLPALDPIYLLDLLFSFL